ncbi:ClpC-like protein [Tanacetum coccineum]
MFVMERGSGVTCCFDVVNHAWSGAYDMRPDPRVVYSVIGYCESDNKIIVVGLLSGENNENVIKVYGVDEDLSKCDEISEMPLGRGDDEVTMTSFDVVMAGNVMYVYNKGWGCEEVIMCEFVNGGCKWSKVVNMVVKGGSVNVMDMMVFTCGKVGMEELRGAMRSGERRFVVKQGNELLTCGVTKLEVKEIADIMLKEVFERLKVKEIELQVTERFRDRVVEEGYNPSYGARPLRRAIMRLLEDSMAEKMLAREIKEGDSVIVDVDADGNVTVLNGGSGAPPSETLPEPIEV